jgi:hypothetical protein
LKNGWPGSASACPRPCARHRTSTCRFDGAGNKTDNARVAVVWNGIVVHNDVVIDGGTGDSNPENASPGAIRLQDHDDAGANPRFRNIWIEPTG